MAQVTRVRSDNGSWEITVDRQPWELQDTQPQPRDLPMDILHAVMKYCGQAMEAHDKAVASASAAKNVVNVEDKPGGRGAPFASDPAKRTITRD